MGKMTAKELRESKEFSIYNQAPKPLVFRNKANKICWFLTSRPGKNVEVLSNYVALLDLEDGRSLVYDSRNTVKIPFLNRRVTKPSVEELKDENNFEELNVRLPEIYQSKRNGNFRFIDDSENVLDHYVCLWNFNGKFIWQEKETDFEKNLDLAETLVSNHRVLDLLGRFGVNIPEKLAKTLKALFGEARKNDLEIILGLPGFEDIKKTMALIDAIENFQGKELKLSDLKGLVGKNEKVLENLQELEKFFKGEESLKENLIPILKTICITSK